MRKHHNWNQIHKFLLDKGFKQLNVITDHLYYIRERENGEIDKVHLIKSNKVDALVVEEMLKPLGIQYEEFISRYRQIYLRNR